MKIALRLSAMVFLFQISALTASASIWPIGATCDVPETYRACHNAGLTCNGQTAVCEGVPSDILGRTCDIPTNYAFCYEAGYNCNGGTTICEDTSEVLISNTINKRLYPGNIYTHSVAFGSRTFIKHIDLITDWWQKRPTQIRVYQMVDGIKGALLGDGEFNEYLSQVCGPHYDSACSYPDAADARLSVDFEGELVDGVVIEIEGLLSAPNAYAMLKKIEIRN